MSISFAPEGHHLDHDHRDCALCLNFNNANGYRVLDALGFRDADGEVPALGSADAGFVLDATERWRHDPANALADDGLRWRVEAVSNVAAKARLAAVPFAWG